MKTEHSKLYTIQNASRLTGYSVDSLHKLARAGEIHTTKQAKGTQRYIYILTRETVDALRARKKQNKRPRKATKAITFDDSLPLVVAYIQGRVTIYGIAKALGVNPVKARGIILSTLKEAHSQNKLIILPINIHKNYETTQP